MMLAIPIRSLTVFHNQSHLALFALEFVNKLVNGVCGDVSYIGAIYCIAGIFFFLGGGDFSWMLGFVGIRGTKIVVGLCLNCTPHARVKQWSLYHQYNYKAVKDAQVGYNTLLFPIAVYCPLFLSCLNQ